MIQKPFDTAPARGGASARTTCRACEDPAAALPSQAHPLACVLGFGDIWEGDDAFGCCVVDALLQENLPENVQLAYCGRHFRGVEAWLHQAKVAHVVLASRSGGRPGQPKESDLKGCWPARIECDRLHTALSGLEQALCRLRLIGGEPETVRIHMVTVSPKAGPGATKEMLRAARATVKAILADLSEAGALGELPARTDRLYRSEVLNVTF